MGRTNKIKKQRLGYMGTDRKNVPLNFEMLESDAWKALTPLQHDVLTDWYKSYVRLSHWDFELLAEGMSYTWAHCGLEIREGTFLAAVRRILEVGFFERAFRLESTRPSSPRKFLPSMKWRKFRLNEEQRAKREASSDAKNKRLAEKRARRATFRSTLSEKKEPPASVPTRPSESVPIQDGSTIEKCADTSPKTSDSDHQKVCRSYISPYGYGESLPSSIECANSPAELVAALAKSFGDNRHPSDTVVRKWVERIGLAKCKALLAPVVRNGHSPEKVYGLLENVSKVNVT